MTKNKLERILIAAVIIFLLLNFLKGALINCYVVYSEPAPTIGVKTILDNSFVLSGALDPLIKITKLKFLLWFFLNSLIFLTLLRIKNRAALLGFYGLQTIYLLAHLAYFLFFDNFFHIRQLFWQFSEGGAFIRNFLLPKDIRYLVFFLDLPFLLFIAIKYFNLNSLIRKYNEIVNLVSIVLLVAAVFLSPACFNIEEIKDEVANQYEGEVLIVEKYGLLVNDLIDLLSHRNENALIKNFEHGKTIASSDQSAAGLKNIVCIQVESLDASIIQARYQGEYVTPFLQQLSTQSIFYPYMLVYSGAGSTSDAEFAIFNSMVPLRNFPSMKLRNYDYPNSMIKQLSQSGFEPLAFHNNVGNYFNREVSYSKIGFRKFYDLKRMQLKEYVWGAADHEVLDYVKDKLGQQKPPFFYYIITMSSHHPFWTVKSYYQNQRYDAIKDDLIRDYFMAISYVDVVLEDFVGFIRKHYPETYIFIYSDGPAPLFGWSSIEHGQRPLKLSPLFILTPDQKSYNEQERIVSTLDLAPTILSASGISFQIQTDGLNLLEFPLSQDFIPVKIGQEGSRKQLFEQFINSDSTKELRDHVTF